MERPINIYNVSGIYKISSLKFPNKVYIGASINIGKRFNDHYTRLSRGISAHIKLQNHVNEYGLDDLCFSVLKTCHIDHLEIFEQFYLSELKPVFNDKRFSGMAGKNGALARNIFMMDVKLAHENNEIDHGLMEEIKVLSYCKMREIIIPFNVF